MTQRIFDVENEKDYADLWDILPESCRKITAGNPYDSIWEYSDKFSYRSLFKINWHDKKKITRPIQEATEADVGKLCKFWAGKDYAIGILKEIGDHSTVDVYLMDNSVNGIWFVHCRRLTKQEIEELC